MVSGTAMLLLAPSGTLTLLYERGLTVNQAVQTWRSHSKKGGVLDESYLSTHETSNTRDIMLNQVCSSFEESKPFKG